MDTVNLKWIGPFNYADTSTNRQTIPNEAGIYLWVTGKDEHKFVTYVGEAGNLRNRLYDHMVYTLGGGYWLYDTEKLINGEGFKGCYQSDPNTMNINFIKNYQQLSKVAYENLTCLDTYYAVFNGTTIERKMVESCIITVLKNEKNYYWHMLQNERVSVNRDENNPIHVISEVDNNYPFFQLIMDMTY